MRFETVCTFVRTALDSHWCPSWSEMSGAWFGKKSIYLSHLASQHVTSFCAGEKDWKARVVPFMVFSTMEPKGSLLPFRPWCAVGKHPLHHQYHRSGPSLALLCFEASWQQRLTVCIITNFVPWHCIRHNYTVAGRPLGHKAYGGHCSTFLNQSTAKSFSPRPEHEGHHNYRTRLPSGNRIRGYIKSVMGW